jgi:hypothetical protein
MNNLNKLKIIEYIDKYKYDIDDFFIILLCHLVKYTNFEYKDLKHLLKGAKFVIKNDEGIFYNKLKKYSKKRDMFKHKSSHYSCHKIHRIGKHTIYNTNGKVNKNYDCVIGKICFDKNNKKHDDCNSWFQFEKTRTDTTVNKLKHSFDYLKHLITKQNVGPFGYSRYTDKNPIILNFKKNV